MPITRFKADGLVKDESSLPPSMHQPVTGTPTPIDTEKVTPKRISDDVSSGHSINDNVQRAISTPVSPRPNVEEMELGYCKSKKFAKVMWSEGVDTIVTDTNVLDAPVSEVDHGGDLPMMAVKDATTISNTQPRGVAYNSIPLHTITPRADNKYLNKLATMLCQLPDTIDISDIISDVLTDKDKDELITLAPTDMKPKLIQILCINDLRQLGWDDLDMDELIAGKWSGDTRDKIKEEYTVVMRHVIDKLTTHKLFLKHFMDKV